MNPCCSFGVPYWEFWWVLALELYCSCESLLAQLRVIGNVRVDDNVRVDGNIRVNINARVNASGGQIVAIYIQKPRL
jgi:hypothetical protein